MSSKNSSSVQSFLTVSYTHLDKALDFFYHSFVYQLMKDGVSDMHCMSDGYLADDLEAEYRTCTEESHT